MTRRKRYSAELKREAFRRADEVGITDVLMAEELGINARNLRNWRDAAKRNSVNAFPVQEVMGSKLWGQSKGTEQTR